MATFVFYCNDKKSHIETFEYYKQDIEALEALGHQVIVCTKYREIPKQFDAIFVWWWTYAFWPVLLCRLKGKPCIITGVFNFALPAAIGGGGHAARPLWRRALINFATRFCTLNLFIDEAELASCSAFFKLDNARLYPCGINSDYLQGPGATRELALFNLAWSGTGNLIRKGIPELLQATKLLMEQGVPLHLYLGGPRGDGTEGLLESIKDLGLRECVTWLGPLERDKKIELLRTNEIYVQPSHHEGFGLATAEAMGCGAAIVTCDVGAVRSVVGDCGVYVTPGSPESLAEGIKRVLTDVELRQRLQREGMQRARTVFAPEKKRELLQRYLAEVGIR